METKEIDFVSILSDPKSSDWEIKEALRAEDCYMDAEIDENIAEETKRMDTKIEKMGRDELLKELNNYRFVPGHGPDYGKMSNDKLRKVLKTFKKIFEEDEK